MYLLPIYPKPERRQRPPRFLPFKVGDRIVICSHKIITMERGRTGTINNIYNHLDAVVVLDEKVSPFKRTEKCEVRNVKTYLLRHASECHDCCNRMTHMQGGWCPNDHKDIVFYEEEGQQ